MPKRESPAVVRSRAEAMIETLIALLDQIDGDPDLEDNADDEPSIGGYPWRDDGVDLELDDADKEPSLSWAENIAQHPDILAEGFDPDLLPARTQFDGKGMRAANGMLRSRGLPTVRIPIGYGD
jgi:hypothetical protein